MALVAMEPRRPPATNVGTETAFRRDHYNHFQESKRVLRSEVSSFDQPFEISYILNHIDLYAQRRGFRIEPFPRSMFTLALNLDILDAGRSPNAVRVHAGNRHVNFEVDHPPPAASPPGDLWITMVKETAKIVWKNEKKVKLVRIAH